MMLFRISAVILAFAAIGSHGAVNVTASREYVDRKVTSVSNSIMDEVSSNLRKIESIEKNTYTKDETDKKIVELATTNGVASSVSAATNAMEAVGTDHQIVRGSFNHDGNVWNLNVSYATRADTAAYAEDAEFAGSVPWYGVVGPPTSLSGYGITDAVPSSRTVNGKPLTSDITLSASDLGAATTGDLVAATNGLASSGDVDSKIASATNGLLSTELDPMFTAWTNGTATLSGSFVQGTGFKNALVNNPILASGARSHAQGYATKAYGDNSHAEGSHTVASNDCSHAEGEYTKALGRGSHAEGSHTVASNDYSHAEGEYTVAGGRLSHAGGSYSRAWGDTSRAWGSGATANAAMSVSEGNQTQANGWYSTARGYWTAANGVMSHAEGVNATAEGNPIFSPEDVSDPSDLVATYAWSAVYKGEDTNSNYRSHRPGTYNLNPVGGLAGFYVGETNFQTFLDAKASTGDVQAAISATNPTFSNAVLAVGLNIDMDSVAVLNEIASTFGSFPIAGTATTVGGLLAALAAAIAWLKKNKADKATTLATPAGEVSLAADRVTVIDGSSGTAVSVTIPTVTGTEMRLCELLITGVIADGAIAVTHPANCLLAGGADATSAGANHFVYAEYQRDRWLVTKTVLNGEAA